jgi:hypothetical protein
MGIKRTLTSMQITQFLVGASYAMSHSFVSYTVPVVSTTVVTRKVASPVSSAIAIATAVPSLLNNLKNMLFGADATATPSPSPVNEHIITTTETTYSTRMIPCIPTSGQTFAIWLNVLYLAPLTYLFMAFFVSSYLRRSSAEQARAKKAAAVATTSGEQLSNVTLAEKAGWDAARSVEREVYGEHAAAGDDKANGIPESNGHTRKVSSSGRTLRSRAS